MCRACLHAPCMCSAVHKPCTHHATGGRQCTRITTHTCRVHQAAYSSRVICTVCLAPLLTPSISMSTSTGTVAARSAPCISSSMFGVPSSCLHLWCDGRRYRTRLVSVQRTYTGLRCVRRRPVRVPRAPSTAAALYGFTCQHRPQPLHCAPAVGGAGEDARAVALEESLVEGLGGERVGTNARAVRAPPRPSARRVRLGRGLRRRGRRGLHSKG